ERVHSKFFGVVRSYLGAFGDIFLFRSTAPYDSFRVFRHFRGRHQTKSNWIKLNQAFQKKIPKTLMPHESKNPPDPVLEISNSQFPILNSQSLVSFRERPLLGVKTLGES